MEKAEAEDQVATIGDSLGAARRPEIPWLAVQGKDIVSAHVQEIVLPSVAFG